MNKTIKIISIVLILIQMIMIMGNFKLSNAIIKEGEIVNLKGDHECDSLVEYWMRSENKWSYKIVWYVYYIDKQTNQKYPAFCVEPAKEGVGTGYNSYDTKISKETDNVIWRILYKGYMGSSYKEWDIENDDDFYSATKIAIHSYKEGVSPKEKYVLGNRSVDGNTVDEIQRRGKKALEVAQKLYEYGINGKEVYESPKLSIIKDGEIKKETINNEEYYIQYYKLSSNRNLKSYDISVKDFTRDTKVFDINNQEISESKDSLFKIAIPVKDVKQEIKGKIFIDNAEIKTCPIFYAKSMMDKAQSYVTYTSGYETTKVSTDLNIKYEKEEKYGQIKIIKTSSENNIITGTKAGDPIKDVVFEIRNKSGVIVDTIKTDDKGEAITKRLEAGDYIVKEIKANENYYIDYTEYEVKITENNEIQTLNIKNKPIVKLPRTGF